FGIDYHPGDDMMVTGDAPTSIHATLQGPWANFLSFESTDLDAVVVDLTGAEPGVLKRRIELADIKPPGGMRVISVSPAAIEVTLDRRVERPIEVEAVVPDAPAFGFQATVRRVEPPKVRVVGPATKMRSLEYVTTRPIDVKDRQEDLDIEVELSPPPPGLRLLDKKVRVLVEIDEEMVQKTFQDVPVALDSAPRGTVVTPAAVTVTVKGPRRTIDALEMKAVQLYVETSPENQDGQVRFEKSVAWRNPPERALLAAPVPKVVVELPKPKRKRR
ncbi:MAG: hypothetical protein HYZ27_10495, partial [Deltaproteobacteria bacterium]|nr:hypothetical protein [Deltaproteobacteria bacterium]